MHFVTFLEASVAVNFRFVPIYRYVAMWPAILVHG